MTAPGAAASAAPTTEKTDAARERSFRLVLVGLVVLILGFTAAAFANGLYPCVPTSGSSVQPPLTDCAVSLSPWAAVALVGLALAIVGYRRAR